MSIKFDGKKVQDLSEEDIDRVLDEPKEDRKSIYYCHCLIIANPNILAAHYSKGMAGVIVQSIDRERLLIQVQPGSRPVNLRVSFPKTDSGFSILTVADTNHKFMLSYDDMDETVYATPVEKDTERYQDR
jgi:hypothetical protein